MPGKKMNPFRDWEIYPKIIYDFAIRMRDEYSNKEWFVAENGMEVQNEGRYRDQSSMIQDDYRIDFFRQHLYWAIKRVQEDSNLKGYMNWAFTDNVSPMNAFKNRYGLVEIDLNHNRNRRGYSNRRLRRLHGAIMPIESTLKLRIQSAHRIITARRPDEYDKKYLHLTDTEPVLCIEQVVYMDSGIPFEYSTQHHIRDIYEFKTVSLR